MLKDNSEEPKNENQTAPRTKSEPTWIEQSIPLDKVDCIQVRIATDVKKIEEYKEHLKNDGEFPPVKAFFDEKDGMFYVADGKHRCEAHKLLGHAELNAEVTPGSRRDALLYAVGANAAHGLPRTNDDKRNAIRQLLRDTEWQKLPNAEIARLCRVSDDLVAKVLQEKEFEAIKQNTKKDVVRNGKKIKMETANIGSEKKEPQVQKEAATNKKEGAAWTGNQSVLVYEKPARRVSETLAEELSKELNKEMDEHRNPTEAGKNTFLQTRKDIEVYLRIGVQQVGGK